MREKQNDFLDFLCWVNRCLFPADLRDDLIRLGMPLEDAVYLYVTAFKERMEQRGEIDILWLYQSYCITSKDDTMKTYINKYVDEQYEKWKGYK
jgi:hypothetical protein